MEGQTGIINGEMGTTNTPISGNPETAEAVAAPQEADARPETSQKNSEIKEGENTAADTDTPSEATTDEQREEPQQEQPQPEDELTEEQITERFNEIWNNIDEETKNDFSKVFSRLLKSDKEAKAKKLSEISIELLRSLKLMFAIISLVSSPFRELQPLYSGKDLKLSDTPPEGNDRNYLSKDSDPDKPQNSWKKFREQVEIMDPMPFGEFMNYVLAKNAEYSKDLSMLKPENEERNAKKLELLQTLIEKKINGRKPNLAKRVAAPPRGTSRSS